jgi:hypothetical protein
MVRAWISGFVVMGFSTAAWAQGANITTPQDIDFETPPSDPAGWYWGGPHDPTYGGTPVIVYLDPDGQPIEKFLQAPIAEPTTYVLTETIRAIAPPDESGVPYMDWADWHEQILTPGWEWVNGSFTAGGTSVPGLIVDVNGANIDFYFNPIEIPLVFDAPLVFQIVKEFKWMGSGAPRYPIEIIEYPTPEPTTLGLLAVGGLVMLRRRRR